MNNLAFSINEVNKINERVRSEISSRLYLFCNYNSDIITCISSDAKFIDGILELYKILIDTNCILTKYKFIIFGEQRTPEWRDFTNRTDYFTLSKHLDLISTLRSIRGHNNDDRNGLLEQNQLASYNNWLKGIIGKDKPVAEADFNKLLEALNTIGLECCNSVDKIITYIAQSPHKEEIAKRWEEAILEWYNRKREVFLGQMGIAWLSKRMNETGNAYNMPLIKSEVLYHLRVWIKNYYEQPYINELKRLNLLMAQYSSKIKNADELADFTERVQAKIEICHSKHEDMISEIQRFCRRTSLKDQDYSDYFFGVTLSKLIRETMNRYDCNLLPQDLLQLVIRDYFVLIND